ncbi:MAG: SUMF1/EgtB/PvdO family nonheme iron enzyme [Saprospiraceae bacterium]|nr:SUMF1/EgtB/PvdO family nonheme iron enzyme [Saprospiraceae bacterium]
MTAVPKEALRELIALAQAEQALVQLLDLLSGKAKYKDTHHNLILLRGQYSHAANQFKLGLIEFSDLRRETTRIEQALLGCLDQLPDQLQPANPAAPETTLRQHIEQLAADADWEYDLFFSFSSHDLAAARDFCDTLRGYGLRVFFSADDLRLRAGHNFGDTITRALRNSRHFLLFCTPGAMASEWVNLEHDTFFQQFHLKDRNGRLFHIAEGPGFEAGLVPDFYRRYQRLRAPEDLLHSLGATAPRPERTTPPLATPSVAKPSAADEHAWEFTLDAGTRAAFEKYLARFPQGYYAAEARERLEAFEADDTAWEFASEAGTERAIRKYLDKYPEGLHAAEARALLDPFHELMVPVKGGTFEMGDVFGEGGDSEKPVHKVTVRDFYLCKYPVTQGQWQAIMGNNPSHFKGNDKLPVENVSWDDAQAFIKKLNEKTGLNYRLPTEAEWEYAAREGRKKVRFGNGKDIADPAEMNFKAAEEYKQPYSKVGEYRQQTTLVDQFPPNALGLHDMSGNVWEWCEDRWHDDYKGAPDNGSAWTTGENNQFVCRGGSWYNAPGYCRASSRDWYFALSRYYYLGFRVARGY